MTAEDRVRWEAEGDVSPDEAAAIGAVIALVVSEAAAHAASSLRSSRRSAWVLAGLPRGVPAPLAVHPDDAHGWTEVAEPERTNR
jgi:hypothetical protein